MDPFITDSDGQVHEVHTRRAAASFPGQAAESIHAVLEASVGGVVGGIVYHGPKSNYVINEAAVEW